VDQLSGPVPHLVIGGGKDGYLYLLNRDAMGGLGDANASQRFNFGNPILSTGAFWNNTFYMAGLNGKLQAFSFNTSTGKFNPSNVSQSSATYGFGSTPSVSSSGTTNGIVWALDNQNTVRASPPAVALQCCTPMTAQTLLPNCGTARWEPAILPETPSSSPCQPWQMARSMSARVGTIPGAPLLRPPFRASWTFMPLERFTHSIRADPCPLWWGCLYR